MESYDTQFLKIGMSIFLIKKLKLFPFKKYLIIYLILAVLGLHCCLGFSLVPESGRYCVVATHTLLTVAASLVAEHAP